MISPPKDTDIQYSVPSLLSFSGLSDLGEAMLVSFLISSETTSRPCYITIYIHDPNNSMNITYPSILAGGVHRWPTAVFLSDSVKRLGEVTFGIASFETGLQTYELRFGTETFRPRSSITPVTIEPPVNGPNLLGPSSSIIPSKSLRAGAIIGIVIGCAIVLFVISFIIFMVSRIHFQGHTTYHTPNTPNTANQGDDDKCSAEMTPLPPHSGVVTSPYSIETAPVYDTTTDMFYGMPVVQRPAIIPESQHYQLGPSHLENDGAGQLEPSAKRTYNFEVSPYEQ